MAKCSGLRNVKFTLRIVVPEPLCLNDYGTRVALTRMIDVRVALVRMIDVRVTPWLNLTLLNLF